MGSHLLYSVVLSNSGGIIEFAHTFLIWPAMPTSTWGATSGFSWARKAINQLPAWVRGIYNITHTQSCTNALQMHTHTLMHKDTRHRSRQLMSQQTLESSYGWRSINYCKWITKWTAYNLFGFLRQKQGTITPISATRSQNIETTGRATERDELNSGYSRGGGVVAILLDRQMSHDRMVSRPHLHTRPHACTPCTTREYHALVQHCTTWRNTSAPESILKWTSV